MKKFIVDSSFFDIFPQATIGVIVLKNIENNYENKEEYEKLLRKSQIEAREFIEEYDFKESLPVKKWREAFQKIITKKKARCSIEALLKRVANNNPITNINPLVDLYNCASLKFATPCGGEDIDKIENDILLTKAKGDEYFMALGDEKSECPLENEMVYKDGGGVVCRSLNWREAQRTMLTEESKNIIFFMEEIDQDIENLNNALNYLNDLFLKFFNVKGEIHLVNKENPQIEF